MDKLLGLTPDAEPTLPGVITSCTNLIPYEQGMKGAPSASTPASTPALAAACQGAAVVTRLNETRRILAGTQTKLYELVAGAWTDLSGAVYTGGSESRWSITQFGNSTIASNLADYIQRSTDTGVAFATIATAPRAKIVFTVGAFVMALNTNDPVYGLTPNRWWCCASYNDTSWTPSVTTLATTGELVSTQGQIVAGGRLGEYAVAYKDTAIYVGQFVGAPAVWDWTQIPGGNAGCVGQDAWCDVGGAHFIIGQDNIWVFDGSRPSPIGVGQLRQWFYDNSSPGYRYKTQCVFDRQNNLVWTFYCANGSTVPNQAIVYHMLTKQWGAATMTIETVLNYISAGVTIDDLSSISATIDGLASYAFDSQFWLNGGRALSVIDSSHQVKLMTGVSTSSSFTTGDAGDDDIYSLLSRIRLRFAPGYSPATALANTGVKASEGDAVTNVNSGVAINDGKFDVLQSGRFHRATFDFTGDVRILGISAVLTPQGNA